MSEVEQRLADLERERDEALDALREKVARDKAHRSNRALLAEHTDRLARRQETDGRGHRE